MPTNVNDCPEKNPTAMTTRRDFLLTAACATAACAITEKKSAAHQPFTNNDDFPVTFALNTSTIRGQKLPVDQQVQIVAKAGYDGIEPWIGDIRQYVDSGGQLSELAQTIVDAGLRVVSAITFAPWIVNDKAARAAGLQQMRSDMELVAAIGGNRIAAPPVGAHQVDHESPGLSDIADRYGDLLRLGEETGVTPQLELWGFSKTLSTLGELAYVAAAANHANACVLPDFYHIYKGAKNPHAAFLGLDLIEASRIHNFHINDYPADPPQSKIADKHRVFPGDGVCDLPHIIRSLLDHGFVGSFSLELFNPDYWKQDAEAVCSEGLEKSKAVVQAALDLDG